MTIEKELVIEQRRRLFQLLAGQRDLGQLRTFIANNVLS